MSEALRLWLGLSVQLGIALLPGLALAVLIRRVDAAIILCGSGLAALASFYATWATPGLGRAWTVVVLASSVAVCGFRLAVHLRGLRTSAPGDLRAYLREWRTRARDVAAPILLVLGMGWLLLGSLALHGGYGELNTVAGHRYVHALPIDNLMPELLADRVIAGEPVKPFVAEWLSSDRPPLQTGFTTLVRPVRFGIDRDSQYQVLGTGLQLLVLPALWWFLVRLMRHAMSERTARSSASAVVLAVAFSGLVVLHATYVWPKLLSAAFVFLAAAVLLGPRDRWRAPTAGVSVGLAMMAHGSAVFALPLLAALVLVRSRRRNEMLAIAGALMMVLAPWSAYQRWIDPPGNRLLKWHLGGVEQIDERSTLRTIRDSYSHLSLADVAHLKRENVSFLYNHARVFGDAFPITGSTALVRAREFAHVANSLGVAWLAVPFALAAMIRSRWRERPATLFGAALVALALAAIGLWCVVMFGPATTFVHAGTLALPILLLAALVVWSAAIHPAIPWAVAGLGVVRGFHVWLLARPAADAGLDPRISKGAILLMVTGGVTLAATAALSALGFRTSFRAAAAPGALPRVPPASQ